jgi:hypothetical protein
VIFEFTKLGPVVVGRGAGAPGPKAEEISLSAGWGVLVPTPAKALEAVVMIRKAENTREGKSEAIFFIGNLRLKH